ncbi:MAG: hypothetical protein E7163_02270 [Firmicutes bacterium]|nr:hypothetical protein [Bacillota bacterium]
MDSIKIYIVVTHTGSSLSKLIKYYSNSEFSHVSISLDEDLDKMYSFGRLNPYNPFWGGFVHEEIDNGTFKRFDETPAKVYEISITKKQYKKIEKSIKEFEKNKKDYKFNIIGLVGVAINKKIQFEKAFYCAEFVKYLLENAGVENNLPDLATPDDFKNLENNHLVYEGLLKDYKI